MTREEAIEMVKTAFDEYENEYDTGNDWSEEHKARDMAIKALEQEPILDKIRAEVERLQKMCDKDDLNLLAQYSALGSVLDIFDRYKAESEEKK